MGKGIGPGLHGHYSEGFYSQNDVIAFFFVSSDAPSLQGFWWSNEKSRLLVLSELPKTVYYWTWRGLLGIVEDHEWAVELERVYLAVAWDYFWRVVF